MTGRDSPQVWRVLPYLNIGSKEGGGKNFLSSFLYCEMVKKQTDLLAPQ